METKSKTLEKRFSHEGFQCEIHMIRSHRCGYVKLPKDHIAALIGLYDDIPVSVHGGLTYGEVEGKYFVVGFDCGHANDTLEKWTVEAVTEEVKRLAEQLKKITWRDAVLWKMRYMPEWFKARVSY